jgi:pyruvate,water dikinase
MDVEALRADFKARYQSFKQLLTANSRALDHMGELERALSGAFAFDMAFIQSRCTRISTNVFQIVRQINHLSDDRYAVLFERFKAIQRKLNPFVYPRTPPFEGPPVMPVDDIDGAMTNLVGSKIATISQIRREPGLAAPDGFAVTTSGYQQFMAFQDLQVEINRRIQAADIRDANDRYALSADLQQLILMSPIPPDLEKAIMSHFDRLSQGAGSEISVAVRSSALGEDTADATFAGQYRSILNVTREGVLTAYKEVVASKYSPTAMAYRLYQGIRDQENAMSVGVMVMVDAVAGGVLYTRSPFNRRDDQIRIYAAWGLPKSVVDGTSDTDVYGVERGDPPRLIDTQVAHKTVQFVCHADEGVCRLENVLERQSSPCLTESQAVALARQAMVLESHFGGAQDIEWAIDPAGKPIILQSRPLIQSSSDSRPKGGTRQTDPGATPPTGPDSALIQGGVTASPGAAAGPVFLLEKESDLLRFPDGAVLVTRQALPRWAMLLNRAAAVITATGSIAGHLANVAREFSVPAVFGLPQALEQLSEAQVVTVDADELAVYDGRIESILADVAKPRILMEKSPVYQNLAGAAKRILPLNLIDPDSTDFRAANCRTMHDITRFCHENAVREVFRFGKAHHFDERAAKRLRHKVPLQWWVLNLDDGFAREVKGDHVELENIASIPMLALWEGMVAFPWEGPPAIDGRGLMAVMFQSTANRHLVPTVKSSYANRNYFMIARNFCHLQSRLGYHFATVEALVSERAPENYIVFHFKGGAADLNRRLGRVQLIEELLEERGFSVRLHQDALSARIEDQEMATMQDCLRILGYLNIHTRQLDMVMANSRAVERYRDKIRSELSQLLADR